MSNLLSRFTNRSVPVPVAGSQNSLMAATACAASGAYTYTDIVNVEYARTLTLLIDYDPAAIGGCCGIIPVVCNDASPVATDDVWFCLPAHDGTFTPAVLGGAKPTNADWTATPDFGFATTRALVIKTEPADNATDEIRLAVTLDVTPFRHIQFAYAEHGVTGTPGTCIFKYVLGV